jgi:hypothetical protein
MASAASNPPSESPPPPRRASRGLLAAIAAIIVIVALILGLGFANVIPGFHLSSSGKTTGGGGGATPTPPAPTPAHYTVTFSESGLPASTSWSVTMGGSTQSSSTASITFSEVNGSYSYSVSSETGYTVDPGPGTISVHGAAVSQPVTFSPISSMTPTYSVTFTETGLPAGTDWSVTVGGTAISSTTTTVSIPEANGSYAFTVGPVSGYSPSPPSGTLTVNGAAVTQSIAFSANAPATYSVTFSETGLPSGTSWTVTFNATPKAGLAPASIVFSNVENGSYPFTASAAGYTATPSSGTLPVAGAPVSQSITFKAQARSGATYPVKFQESGLATGTEWGVLVVVNNSAFFIQENDGSSTSFALPNGTYGWGADLGGADLVPYGYDVSPGNGTFTVSGHAVTVSLIFSLLRPTAALYAVNFTESGLPSAHVWTITFNGSARNLTGTSTQFSVVNGTYNFSITASGYDATQSTGTALVDGSRIVVSVDFVAAYLVTFTEKGLPNNGNWTVALNGSSASAATGSSITFQAPAGTYLYTVALPAAFSNYSAQPGSGSILVTSSGASVTITFTLSPHSVVFSETGLPAGDVWFVLVGTSVVSSYEGANLSGSSIYFSLANGNYTYEIVSATYPAIGVSGYIGSPVTGSFTVNGASVTQSVTFVASAGTGFVTFYALEDFVPGVGKSPQGSSWSVTLGSDKVTTQGLFIYFEVANGTYNYTITPPAGDVAIPSSGTLVVDYVTGGPFVPAGGADVYFAPSGGTPFGPSLAPGHTPGSPALALPLSTHRSGGPASGTGLLLVRWPVA